MPAKMYTHRQEKVANRARFIRKVLYSGRKVGSDEKERCYNKINNFQVAFVRSLN